MKNATLLFLCCAVFSMAFIACKKENQQTANASIVGKWKLYSSAFGIGGPMLWNKVAATDNHYVQFYADGKLKSNQFNDTDGNFSYNTYAVKDSLLTISSPTAVTLRYRHIINQDTLTMSALGPPYCIEGCAIRFVRE